MTKVIIRTDKVEGFFDRARKAAQKADRGESFKKSPTFSYEDPQEIFTVLSEVRRCLKLDSWRSEDYLFLKRDLILVMVLRSCLELLRQKLK